MSTKLDYLEWLLGAGTSVPQTDEFPLSVFFQVVLVNMLDQNVNRFKGLRT